jgi:hypothetical protein
MDYPKISEGALRKALDVMLAANWLTKYVENAKRGFAIQWTEKGEAHIRALFTTVQDLGAEALTQDLLWSVVTIANQIYGPDGKGIHDIDIPGV